MKGARLFSDISDVSYIPSFSYFKCFIRLSFQRTNKRPFLPLANYYIFHSFHQAAKQLINFLLYETINQGFRTF